MRFLLLFLISIPAFAVEHQGPCARSALSHVLKANKNSVADFSLRLPQKEYPEELHVYEVGFKVKDSFYHGEVAVEFVGGKCLTPKLQYLTLLD